MKSSRSGPLVALAITLLSLVVSPTTIPARERVIVSPSVSILKQLSDKPPTFIRKGVLTKQDFGGSLRFEKPLDESSIAALEAIGVRFARDGARVRHVGTIYPCRIAFAGLDQVLEFPGLVQVDSEFLLRPTPALDTTRPQTGSTALSEQLELAFAERPGEGVRLMDLDDGLDYHHPAFFRADGGYYPWLDVNGDGLLTPGVDAVDINGDGIAQADETLRLIDTANIDFSMAGTDYGQADGEYRPGTDWLYADTNENFKRDFGSKMGFSDQSPGFGEPMFVADDVDGDLVVDANEKLVMLKSSKIEKMYVHGKTFTYGEDLTELDTTDFDGAYPGIPAGFHGTAVSGIMAGNTPLLTRYVGMAPYATLLMSDDSMQGWGNEPGLDGLIGKLDWARKEHPDIIVMPLGITGNSFMDGTTNFELAMDELRAEDGIIIVVAAGNEGGAGKHFETALPPDETTLGMLLPDTLPDHEEIEYYAQVMFFSVYWQGEPDDLSLSLQVPGMAAPVELEDGGGWHGNPLGQSDIVYSSDTEMSAAGWSFKMVLLFDQDYDLLPNGDWVWSFQNKSGGNLNLHGFASDGQYSSARSMVFEKWESSSTTVSVPGTANTAVTAAAYAGREEGSEGLGMLRDYSSRGPRMDGPQAVDISAPDDPFAPFATQFGSSLEGIPYCFGCYMAFSGTSGASPHVAGSLALLRQYYKEKSADELVDLLLKGALVEEPMGSVPNPEWGSGKVQVYKAVFGEMPPANDSPVASAEVASQDGTAAVLDASASVDPEGEGLQYRWDLNYDGKYQTGWRDVPTVECEFESLGPVTVKLEVRDPSGATDRTLLSFELTDEPVVADGNPNVHADVQSGDIPTSGDAVVGSPSDGTGADDASSSPGIRGGGGCSAGQPSAGLPTLLWMLAGLLLLLRRRFAQLW